MKRTSVAFLTTLYEYAPEGLFLVLWRLPDRQSLWIPTELIPEMVPKALDLCGPGTDVFYGVALQWSRPHSPTSRRGSVANAAALPGLWLDVDTRAGCHTAGTLPDRGEALRFVEGLPWGRPSLVVDSGGGYHVYYLFKEPWLLESGTEREAAADLSRRFHVTVADRAREFGWHLDITADLTRALRLPGTLNHKSERPVPVRVAQSYPSHRYNPSDIEPLLVDDDPGFKPVHPGVSLRFTTASGDIESIAQSCPWMRHCRDDAATLSEPEWYAALSILGRCRDGQALAHIWSAPYPTYDPEETQAKLHRALTAAGPRTCRNIATITAGRFCTLCRHKGNVRSPIVLGQGPDGFGG